ncbi:hypothetical protein C7460_104108 [Marinoscillum furvescens DSM 4134]|uniref:Uncharacterized protein n=1 Tax=Marinoscillum furvescens DSM 4134 TaxID=1122208 RepID=A0A3D9L6W1_MARFU|nr:hypothetical protein C7460_104108 [Marinoscillum furvescens DSM 4134]
MSFNAKSDCPKNTQCRNCEHYTHDPKIGFKNIKGSQVESGKCALRKGPTYATWYGWVDINNPFKQNEKP